MFTFTSHRGTEAQRFSVFRNRVALRLCVSVARDRERRRDWLVAAIFMLWLPVAAAQQLLDRVLARVDGTPITLTDVQAAIGLEIIQTGSGDPITAGTQQMIDRQLELVEVQRFPPPEPMPDAVAREVARLKTNAGTRLSALMQSTGLTEERITDVARDNVRITAYLDQRFGTTVQVSDEEVAAYYRAHEAEFTARGEAMPFEQAEPIARQRASPERRRATVDQGIRDLRARADVTVNPPLPPTPSTPSTPSSSSTPDPCVPAPHPSARSAG